MNRFESSLLRSIYTFIKIRMYSDNTFIKIKMCLGDTFIKIKLLFCIQREYTLSNYSCFLCLLYSSITCFLLFRICQR